MTSPLSTQARIVAELRARLKAEYDLEDGEAALEDTLEGASDLPEMLARMAREIVLEEKAAEAIGELQEAMSARIARREGRAQNLRVQLAWAMSEAGMKRIPDSALPDMTVTMRAGKAPLMIDDEARIPFMFVRSKVVESVDRAAVREALEGGALLDFARLGNPAPVLTIRCK